MLYPFLFQPTYRRYLWGGRRLETVLGKELGPGDDYAESWEVVDHGDDQSVVANGPLAGWTLHELVVQYAVDLLGIHGPLPRFPLLFKFLDANQNLSVQVHPDDARAVRLDPPDLGKTEAWVILHAEPGAMVYAGLKRGFDRSALAREVSRGTTELCLHRFEPRPGDCVFIPAGVVHALGAGLVIAEIQQSSDTTYRLSDWNRVDARGQPRPLHIEQALEAIDYGAGPIDPVRLQSTESPERQRLVKCDKFVLDRISTAQAVSIVDNERFRILAVIDGLGQLEHEGGELPLTTGRCLLVPASIGRWDIVPADGSITVLDAYLP